MLEPPDQLGREQECREIVYRWSGPYRILRSVSYTHLDVYKRQSYNKLPNPLAQIVQQLPVVDGLEVDKLIPFFRTLFQLSDFPDMSDRTLLELIYPYCRGSMAERVAQTMRCGGGIAEFHREVLEAFVMGRLLKQLKQQHFYRVQAWGESLAAFVHRVRDAARILGVGLSEGEVVQIILEGVTPQERLRLVFALSLIHI